MGNMGTIPATGYESSVVQTFSSPTGTSHTMTYAANVSDMVLVINNVIQEPTVAYTTSGTTLTTATLVSGDTMYIIYLALSRQTVNPGANTVDETKLKDNLGMAFTEVTVTAADSFLLCDATDSGNNKRDTVQGVIDLVHGATAGVSTIWVPALAMVSPTTNGAEVAAVETTAVKPELKVLNFDPSTIEYAQFSVAMPKSWNEGTVTAKFYWTHATAVATDVMWGIQGVCVSDNDTIDATFGTAIIVTDTFHNAAEDLAISPETAAITLGGTPAEDDLAYFQVYRAATTGGDTTNSTDAQLIGVKIFFTTNAENDA